MLGFIKALAARTRLFAEEAGQNLVETALIIGVVTVVIVGVITQANVGAQVSEVTKGVVCALSGGEWDAGAVNSSGIGADAGGTCNDPTP